MNLWTLSNGKYILSFLVSELAQPVAHCDLSVASSVAVLKGILP